MGTPQLRPRLKVKLTCELTPVNTLAHSLNMTLYLPLRLSEYADGLCPSAREMLLRTLKRASV